MVLTDSIGVTEALVSAEALCSSNTFLTAAEVSGVPSWKLMPERSLMVQVL